MDIFSVLYENFFSYTGMGALGLTLSVVMAVFICRKRKLEPARFLFLFVLSVLPVYFGAKLFGILSLGAYRLHMRQALSFADIKNAGIVFYGGVFAYLLYMRLILQAFYKKKFRQAYNTAALLVPLFHGYARIGCYCAHCCYGAVSEAAVFGAFYEHRVPVQLLEAAFELCLFLVLGLLFAKKKFKRTALARIYLGVYSAFRFLMEFFRGDEIRGFIGPLSFSQWAAIGVFIYLLIARFKKGAAEL